MKLACLTMGYCCRRWNGLSTKKRAWCIRQLCLELQWWSRECTACTTISN